MEAAKALLANPDIGVTQIAHRLGVSPATDLRRSACVRAVIDWVKALFAEQRHVLAGVS
jgi:hypothetical protein